MMGEIKNNETEKPIEKPSDKSEISKKEADQILDNRFSTESDKPNPWENSTEKENNIDKTDSPTILDPNSKYYKDGHTYETDDKWNIYKVDSRLLPNTSYEVNGYKYKTGDKGRIIKANGQLKLEPGERDLNAQKKAGGEDRKSGDQGGHLVADRFGGAGGVENLVAMKSELNQGDYKKMENDLAKAISQGKEVTVSIDVKYDDDSQRPSSITVTYTIDGETLKKVFTN